MSYGDLACNGSPPGVYTRVGVERHQELPLAGQPGQRAAQHVSAPIVDGTAAVGQTITCAPGGWDGAPAFDYQFVRGLDDRTTFALTNLGAQSSYVVSSADVGSQLGCVVKAHNGGGLAFKQSAWTSTVPAPPVPVPPSQSTNQPSQNQQDIAAPVARITATRLHGNALHAHRGGHRRGLLRRDQDRAGHGALELPQPVQAQGHAQDRRLHQAPHDQAERRGADRHALQGRGLQAALRHAALHRCVAVDKAGHRQALPTTKTVKTKKPRKHR